MKILLASADPSPILTPSLAARLPALPTELGRAGHEVSVVAPLGADLAARLATLKAKATGVTLQVALGENPRVAADVLEVRSSAGLQMFLLRQPDFFEKHPQPIAEDDPAAGALFARLTVELARRLNPAPDIVQAQDWPGALVLVLLRAARLPFTSVLTLPADFAAAAQGSFPIESFSLLNLGWEWFTPATLEFFGRLNCLKGGIAQADALVVDGEADRRAVQTPAHGAGLDAVLREHAGRLHAIPDGLDEAAWNPGTDKLLPRRYRPAALAGKKTSANVFLPALGLGKNPAGSVYLLHRPPVGAPAPELLPLLAPALDQLLADDARLLVLGGGPVGAADDEPSRHLEIAARKFPAKMVILRADVLEPRLQHGALAAADFLLCLGLAPGAGAAVLRALRYGVVPVLPAGSGLETLADDLQPALGNDAGQALVFRDLTTAGLLDTLFGRARPLVAEQPARWEGLRQRAMMRAGKFNWSRAAAEYAGLYARLRGR